MIAVAKDRLGRANDEHSACHDAAWARIAELA
jgi:hypothetical protein